MLNQINHAGVMIQMVGHDVSVTVLSLTETVEPDLRLMIYDRGVLGAFYSVALLLDRIEQAEDVAGRLNGIEVGPFSDLALEVLVAAPQDIGEHLA